MICRASDGGRMERETFRVPKQQVEGIEELVEEGVFPNKSEAMRAAVRDFLDSYGLEASTPSWMRR